jgi:cytochrome c oxidase subunit 2
MSGWFAARKPSFGQVLGGLLLLSLLALLLTGCETDTPQNTFAAEGDVARTQRDLFYYSMWPAIGVMILVEGLIVIMLLRFRRREGDRIPKQTHGNMPLEIAWTVIPAIMLLILGVPMVFAIYDVGREPRDDAYPIDVIGVQWTWEFEYPDILDADGEPVFTTEELHIPAGREIGITLTAKDVIHSFAIPRIAGTRDAVPGEENRMWIKADEPGSYAGQCREFCGLDHADMKITLIVQSQEDFDAWAREVAAGVRSAEDSSDTAVAVGDGGE